MDFDITIRNATLKEAQMLFALLPEREPASTPAPQPSKAPVETIHARVVETPKHYHSKWQIPFSYRDDKKAYQNAWNLCKKHNLPYPEAVIKQAAENHNPSPVTTKPPEPEAPVTPAPVTMDTIPKTESVVGWKVKQIKPDRGRQVPGNLMVTARRNGLIECMYEGKRQIIDAKCLEVVRVLDDPK